MFRTATKWIAAKVVGAAVLKVVQAVNVKALAEQIFQVESLEIAGAQKKRVVLAWLEDHVDIPLVSKKIEREIWSVLIDALVDICNTYLWKRVKAKTARAEA